MRLLGAKALTICLVRFGVGFDVGVLVLALASISVEKACYSIKEGGLSDYTGLDEFLAILDLLA